MSLISKHQHVQHYSPNTKGYRFM
uniref:Uncharacterized protein n=1 Tax=Moniliophthora roreri TaxID=221103 RepID=A0A0W0F995_MONRR